MTRTTLLLVMISSSSAGSFLLSYFARYRAFLKSRTDLPIYQIHLVMHIPFLLHLRLIGDLLYQVMNSGSKNSSLKCYNILELAVLTICGYLA